MTAKEVAAFLDITETTVYRLAKQKKIPGAVRVGNQWRFDFSQVRSMFEETEKRYREKMKKVKK